MGIVNNEMERRYPMRKRRRVRVSSKRQLTIPKEYYDILGIGDDVFVEIHGDRLVVRPAIDVDLNQSEFAELIYKDVISEGYEGNEIIKEVDRRKKTIRPAVDRLIKDAIESSEPTTIEELFEEDPEKDNI